MSKLAKVLVVTCALVFCADSALAQKAGIGREAKPDEIAGWAIGVRPDGQGLPPGKGTVAEGEEIFQAGGHGSLKHERPEKTIGSFWPNASTVFDYIRRAMPFGNAQSLSNDELYAVTAYVLHLNDVIKDTKFELNQGNFATIKLPNEEGFYDDDRETTEKHFWNPKVCMKDCRPAPKVTGRAAVLDVTPDAKSGPKVD
jgi:S-disulfanyl-L-cysteine oxidoreductase SoxD